MKKISKASLFPLIMSIITLCGSICWLYIVIKVELSYIIFVLSLLPFICALILTVCSIIFKDKEYTKALTLTLTGILAFWLLGYYVFLLFISNFFVQYFCQQDLLQSVESPNGEYTINTYRENCGATTDFVVTGELCNKNNKCKEIYTCYHEDDSFVYWIDDQNVFINNKKLNIYNDKYDWHDDDNYQDNLYKK